MMETREESVNLRIRVGVLVLLCCQNAGHALLTRYSQGILRESYSSTEVVLVGEFMKLIVSGYLALTDTAETGELLLPFYQLVVVNANAFEYRCHYHKLSIDTNGINGCFGLDAQGKGPRKLLWLIINARKIVVLVFLYALSNLLSYYALARVDASAYTVLLQVRGCCSSYRAM